MKTAANQMTTELRNPQTMQLDTLSSLEIREIMNQEDASVPRAIHGHLEEIARKFDCEVTIQAKGKSTSAASMIGLMNLGAAKGDTLLVTAEGREARPAIQALKTFMMQNL